ncbi:MAG: hypothetical protein C4321_00285, partial [Chloroflexota bacterium]
MEHLRIDSCHAARVRRAPGRSMSSSSVPGGAPSRCRPLGNSRCRWTHAAASLRDAIDVPEVYESAWGVRRWAQAGALGGGSPSTGPPRRPGARNRWRPYFSRPGDGRHGALWHQCRPRCAGISGQGVAAVTNLVFRSFIPVAPEELFEFHADVRNLAAISPPVPPFRLESEPVPTREGDVQVFRLGWRRVGVRWVARIARVVPGRLIEDVQVEGPFRRWRHQHLFLPAPGGSWLEDRVALRLLPTA